MKVYFTKRARDEYQQISTFLTEEWGQQVADTFQREAIHLVSLISNWKSGKP